MHCHRSPPWWPTPRLGTPRLGGPLVSPALWSPHFQALGQQYLSPQGPSVSNGLPRPVDEMFSSHVFLFSFILWSSRAHAEFSTRAQSGSHCNPPMRIAMDGPPTQSLSGSSLPISRALLSVPFPSRAASCCFSLFWPVWPQISSMHDIPAELPGHEMGHDGGWGKREGNGTQA